MGSNVQQCSPVVLLQFSLLTSRWRLNISSVKLCFVVLELKVLRTPKVIICVSVWLKAGR